MFNCDVCHKPAGYKVSPTLKVVEQAPKVYYDYDPDDLDLRPEDRRMVVVGEGWEIKKEIRLCQECVGVEVPTPDPSDSRSHLAMLLGQAESRFGHARNCTGLTKVKDREGKVVETIPCRVCTHNRAWFDALSPLEINHIHSEVYHQGGKSNTVGSVAIDRLIERTMHESKRAKADVATAMQLFKAYEAEGGSI
jgi:hypothetical protein